MHEVRKANKVLQSDSKLRELDTNMNKDIWRNEKLKQHTIHKHSIGPVKINDHLKKIILKLNEEKLLDDKKNRKEFERKTEKPKPDKNMGEMWDSSIIKYP